VLTRNGYLVDCAEGVWRYRSRRQASYDLILMDLQMPEVDGLAATRPSAACPDMTLLPSSPSPHSLGDIRAMCREHGMQASQQAVNAASSSHAAPVPP